MKIRIVPTSEIRGMRKANPRIIKNYIDNGWVYPEEIKIFKHVDLVFPRTTVNGKVRAYITKYHLMAPMKRAAEKLGIDKEQIYFEVLDEKGRRFNNIIIEPDLPLITSRKIDNTLETYEYIDSSYHMDADVDPVDEDAFIEVLQYAGADEGLFSRKKWGCGKFDVIVLE